MPGMVDGHAVVLASLLVFAPVMSATAQPAPGHEGRHLYRLEILQAAPGRLLELIDAARQRGVLATRAGDEAPVIARHSQGDHWDLVLIWPMGEWGAYYDASKVARRESAAGRTGLPTMQEAESRMVPLVAWHEDLYVRGPGVDALRAHVKDANLLHFEMMQALPAKRDALVEERRMENAFNRNRGRGETLIFVRDAGAAWDVVTVAAYRNWRHYAESELISLEDNDAAAKKAGFPNADGVGPYMRTLISTHRDTLGPQVRIDK
jgi:hypothetical protein